MWKHDGFLKLYETFSEQMSQQCAALQDARNKLEAVEQESSSQAQERDARIAGLEEELRNVRSELALAMNEAAAMQQMERSFNETKENVTRLEQSVKGAQHEVGWL